MFKLDLEKAKGNRDQIANKSLAIVDPSNCWIIKKAREFKKKIYFFIYYTKAFDCMYHKLLKIPKEMGIPDHLTCLLRNLYAGQEATVRPDMEQWTVSKLGKEYNKAVCCHPAYLTYTQSTSCKMLDWTKHKLESRLLGSKYQ